MFNTPIKANDIEVAMFTSGQYGNDLETLEFEINAWLKNQPKNIVIQDIVYQHSGITSRGKDIISVLVISTPAGSAR